MRKKIISILLILILLEMTCVNVFATTQSDLTNAKNNLSTATKNKKAVTAEKETVLNEIADLEDEIADYQAQITELNSKITKMEKSIKEKNTEIETLQKEYDEKKKLLEDRLVAIYEQGRITFLDVLLASENIWDYISMSSKVQQLTDADNEQMDKVEAQKNEVEEAKNELEKEKKELAESKKTVQDKQAKVKVAKDKKEAKVASLTAEQKKLQTQINNYNKEIQKLEEELAKSAKDYSKSYSGKFVGTLSWPLSKSSPGYNWITSYYGGRIAPVAGATSDHRAIDIGVATGTPVLSAGDGIVISTGYNSARGYFIIIKHADNLYTLYQHLSKILVSKGQTVSTGKTIAKSGSTGIGSGPHLHFEVRTSQYYGSEVNPLDYCHW